MSRGSEGGSIREGRGVREWRVCGGGETEEDVLVVRARDSVPLC